ncbi:MAG TPA: hypothetical protein VEG63_12515 [Candidatus Acidoferrales bacterium]|nr:hypothetical protein [Candidatus Acidoferrales bacterium]
MGVSRRNILAVSVALLAALALAIPVLARPDRAEIVLSRTCHVGSSSLPAGTYQLVFDGNKVSFLRDSKVIAEATGEWKRADRKVEETAVRYEDSGRIVEIRLHGRDSYFALP